MPNLVKAQPNSYCEYQIEDEGQCLAPAIWYDYDDTDTPWNTMDPPVFFCEEHKPDESLPRRNRP